MKQSHYVVRPATSILTRGFDPRLSVGSARPAVFRSSTYVFPSPESAERAFEIALGRIRPAEGEHLDLIYSRLSHGWRGPEGGRAAPLILMGAGKLSYTEGDPSRIVCRLGGRSGAAIRRF